MLSYCINIADEMSVSPAQYLFLVLIMPTFLKLAFLEPVLTVPEWKNKELLNLVFSH